MNNLVKKSSSQGIAQTLAVAILLSLGIVQSSQTAQATTPSITYNDQVCDLGSGSGTLADPYLLSTADQLWEATDCTRVAGFPAYLELANNIDVSIASNAPTNSPIGFSTSALVYSFSGTLDGKGYQISGLAMNRADGVGLFSYLDGATLKNISIAGSFTTSATVNIPSNSAGALAIQSINAVTIDRVTNSANVRGGSRVGGLIGFQIRQSSGTQTLQILNSANLGTIQSTGNALGGLIGHSSWNLLISNSGNSGTISGPTGARQVGGILGYKDQQSATITDSFNFGNVSGGFYAGGIIGEHGAPANIEGSYNSGRVTGTKHVGGLVGGGYRLNIENSFNSGSVSAGLTSGFGNAGGLIGSLDTNAGDYRIEQSFNRGEVAGYEYVGGLLGFDGNSGGTLSFIDSYNSGLISGTSRIGGLVGSSRDQNSLTRTYNSGVVSGSSILDGLVAVNSPNMSSSYALTASRLVSASTLAQLQQAITYDGWNFSSIWGFAECSQRDGLPMLRFAQEFGAFYSSGCLNTSPLSAALTPSFGTPAKTADGFTVQVSNYDGNFTWNASANAGSAAISGTGLITVTGLSSGASSTVTVTTIRSGYSDGSAMVTEAARSATTSGSLSPGRESPSPSYAGPMLDDVKSVHAGSHVTFTGSRLDLVTAAYIGGVQTSISSFTSQSLIISVPKNSDLGTHDLILHSSHGVLTLQNGITILAPMRTLVDVEATDRKLTVGSHTGFVVIYSRGYEGKKLSAKVAGKWLVVSELDESWNGHNYSRTLRAAASGYDVKVHLYIDGKYMRTERITTR